MSLIESLSPDQQQRLDKRRLNLWMKRGWLARKQGDFDDAQDFIGRAKALAIKRCKADPKNPGHRIGLCTALSEWIITAELEYGPTDGGMPPNQARERAREAADIVESLAPKGSRMIAMFVKPFRAYADGKRKAGTLTGAFGG